MQTLFMIIPLKESLPVICYGTVFLFSWELALYLFLHLATISSIRSAVDLHEDSSTTTGFFVCLTSVVLIFSSLCLLKFKTFITWMLSVCFAFIIQTLTLLYALAISGNSLVGYEMFPFTTKSVLAGAELAVTCITFLYVWPLTWYLFFGCYAIYDFSFPVAPKVPKLKTKKEVDAKENNYSAKEVNLSDAENIQPFLETRGKATKVEVKEEGKPSTRDDDLPQPENVPPPTRVSKLET